MYHLGPSFVYMCCVVYEYALIGPMTVYICRDLISGRGKIQFLPSSACVRERERERERERDSEGARARESARESVRACVRVRRWAGTHRTATHAPIAAVASQGPALQTCRAARRERITWSEDTDRPAGDTPPLVSIGDMTDHTEPLWLAAIVAACVRAHAEVTHAVVYHLRVRGRTHARTHARTTCALAQRLNPGVQHAEQDLVPGGSLDL